MLLNDKFRLYSMIKKKQDPVPETFLAVKFSKKISCNNLQN